MHDLVSRRRGLHECRARGRGGRRRLGSSGKRGVERPNGRCFGTGGGTGFASHRGNLRAWQGAYTAEKHSPVELVGLYWHFVDLVWIILFTIIYLLPDPA